MPQYQNPEAVALSERAAEINETAATLEAEAKKLRDEANAMIKLADQIDAGEKRRN